MQYCDGLAEKAATAMESVMQMYPDGIDIVLSSNDDMAMSVVKIIKDSGNAKYADTIVCGFDGNTSAISAIKDGTLWAWTLPSSATTWATRLLKPR